MRMKFLVSLAVIFVTLTGVVQSAPTRRCKVLFRRCRNDLDYEGRVCGTDGTTYQNTCKLVLQACEQRTETTVAHLGRCRNVPQNPAPVFGECPRNCRNVPRKPVCGSDGRKYASACIVQLKRCKNARMSELTVVSPWPCRRTTPVNQATGGTDAESTEMDTDTGDQQDGGANAQQAGQGTDFFNVNGQNEQDGEAAEQQDGEGEEQQDGEGAEQQDGDGAEQQD
ncbi:agrin-like, partial [Acanthaster planci]|uniref:Agrin-like n=1 Tax=Acanthaster planci TaxID=133434 RepID=A0A8B7ZA39_ACAPL